MEIDTMRVKQKSNRAVNDRRLISTSQVTQLIVFKYFSFSFSLSLSVLLFCFLSLPLTHSLSISLSVYLCIYLFVCLSVHLSTNLFISTQIYTHVHTHTHTQTQTDTHVIWFPLFRLVLQRNRNASEPDGIRCPAFHPFFKSPVFTHTIQITGNVSIQSLRFSHRTNVLVIS